MTRVVAVFLIVSIVGCALSGAVSATPAASKESSIGYRTVAAALADLKSQPDNEVNVQDGWTIINETKHHAIWSFTPEGHPAYPAAVKRTFVEHDGAVYVEMTALCQAQKKACDDLIEQFKELNAKMREQMRQQKTQNKTDSPKPTASSDSPQVRTKLLAKGRYELTVTVPGTTDPADAQRVLMPAAVKLCGSRSPQFGKYKFNAGEPLMKTAGTGSTWVTLMQQVSCDENTNELNAPAAAQTQIPLKAPSPADEAIVRARTLDYLSAKDRGDFDIAHAMFTMTMQAMMTQKSWRTPRATFNARAGLPSRREVVRITWYDNPPGLSPGRYAAADYRASYRSAAFYCGYLSWLQEPDGSYRIVREEEGLSAPKEAGKVAPGEMAAMRLQLGCRD